MNLSGSLGLTNATGSITLQTGAQNAVLNLGSSSLTLSNMTVTLGNTAAGGGNTGGAMFQAGGTVTGVTQLKVGDGGYGYYGLPGGVLQVAAIAPATAVGTSLVNFNGGTLKAGASGGAGALYQSGGVLCNTGNFQIGAVGSGYGYLGVSGGTLNTFEFNLSFFNQVGGQGVLDRSGDTVNVGAWMTTARGSSGTGVVTLRSKGWRET